jgi:hypothetical protein
LNTVDLLRGKGSDKREEQGSRPDPIGIGSFDQDSPATNALTGLVISLSAAIAAVEKRADDLNEAMLREADERRRVAAAAAEMLTELSRRLHALRGDTTPVAPATVAPRPMKAAPRMADQPMIWAGGLLMALVAVLTGFWLASGKDHERPAERAVTLIQQTPGPPTPALAHSAPAPTNDGQAGPGPAGGAAAPRPAIFELYSPASKPTMPTTNGVPKS